MVSAVVLYDTVDKYMLLRHAAYSDKLDDGYDERLLESGFYLQVQRNVNYVYQKSSQDIVIFIHAYS